MHTQHKAATVGWALTALVTALTGCSPSQPGTGATSSPSSNSPSVSPTTTAGTSTPTVTATTSEPPLPDCGVGQAAPMSTADSPSLKAAEVVTLTKAGISLYKASNDTTRVLTEDGHGAPVFRSTGTVTFPRDRNQDPSNSQYTFGLDSVIQMSLTDRQETEIVRLPNGLLAQAWDSAGRKLAYLVRRSTEKRTLPSVLCLFNAKTGTTKMLNESAKFPVGRGYTITDEWAVSWSPNDSMIAVVDDAQDPTVRVVTPKGKVLVRKIDGTFARWLPDGRLLYAKYDLTFSPDLKWSPQWRSDWYALNVRTGQKDRIALPAKATWPAVSPDGGMIAFTIPQVDKPTSKVLDLSTGQITSLGPNLMTPIWLSPTEVALTRTEPCPKKNTICPTGALELDKTVGIDLGTMTRTKLKLLSTIRGSWSFNDGADVRLPG